MLKTLIDVHSQVLSVYSITVADENCKHMIPKYLLYDFIRIDDKRKHNLSKYFEQLS